MNSKLLFAATVAISVISTVAMADEQPLTRAQVHADVARAAANGGLQGNGQRSNVSAVPTTSALTRAQVVADLAAAEADGTSLVGSDANPNFYRYTTAATDRSVLTRAEVKADARQAAAAGTLFPTGEEDFYSQARNAQQHTAGSKIAQRLKG